MIVVATRIDGLHGVIVFVVNFCGGITAICVVDDPQVKGVSQNPPLLYKIGVSFLRVITTAAFRRRW